MTMLKPAGQANAPKTDQMDCPAETDVIVIGAGAAGLAAVVAAIHPNPLLAPIDHATSYAVGIWTRPADCIQTPLRAL